MAAQEESHETKQGQDEDRHERRFLVSPAMKVKSLPADRLLASHKAVPVRLDRTAATGLIWFWTLLEAGNGLRSPESRRDAT
jgi:hypothetical protein